MTHDELVKGFLESRDYRNIIYWYCGLGLKGVDKIEYMLRLREGVDETYFIEKNIILPTMQLRELWVYPGEAEEHMVGFISHDPGTPIVVDLELLIMDPPGNRAWKHIGMTIQNTIPIRVTESMWNSQLGTPYRTLSLDPIGMPKIEYFYKIQNP